MNFNYEQAYKLMYLIRSTEEEIVERYHRDQLMRCPTHLSIGQESATVGTIMALDLEDHLYSCHRSHARYLAKGGDLSSMISELHGKASGCTGGWGGSMHLSDESVGFMGSTPVVGDGISLAVGSALAFKLEGVSKVSVAIFGDSAVETGQFWEAANFASLHRLPVLFVCENNLYATATHISQRQPSSRIYERVRPFMESSHVNDSDVFDVYEAAKLARDANPGFLEISTYRYREHAGPNYDWDEGFRTKEEVLGHMDRDPLKLVKAKIGRSLSAQIESATDDLINQAFEIAIAAPWPEGFGQ